jgi:uncharacterized protein YjbI with pentapeptide repeats
LDSADLSFAGAYQNPKCFNHVRNSSISFVRATLLGATLYGAAFDDADFSMANLTSADFDATTVHFIGLN